MKRLAAVVAAVFIAFVLMIGQAEGTNKTKSAVNMTAAKIEVAVKQTAKKRSLRKKQSRKKQKNINTPSMFKKTLFEDPALQHNERN